MFRLFAAFAFVSGAIFWPAQANAELRYETVVADDGTKILFISGEFEHEETGAAFLAEVLLHQPDLVTFDSPGGNIAAAMRLGRLIRSQNLPTAQTRHSECASACALAFFGGIVRFAETGSIGVHKSSFAPDVQLDKDTAVSAVQSMTADIVDYLIEMGISPALLSLSLRYEDWDMRYLSHSEMLELGIVTTGGDAGETAATRRPAEPATSYKQVPTPVSPGHARTPIPRIAMTEAQAAQFVGLLLETHTLPAYQALSRLREYYGGTVDYYGKPQSLDQIMADKQDYFRRWPVRRYQLLHETVSVDCTGEEICSVNGVYRWSVRSDERKRRAAGTASFEYVFTRREPYRVLKEVSKVLQRE